MQWSAVATNQAISYQTLKDACDALIFLQINNIPPPGKTLSQMVTAEWIQSRVDIESSYLTGVPDNELVVKSQVVPVTRTYFKLIACPGNPLGNSWTRINPGGIPNGQPGGVPALQRYVLYGGPNRYWTWNGEYAGPQTTIPTDYNGSIQRDFAGSGTGCL